MTNSIPNQQKPECSLLVLSCDAYSDLWLPFFNLFELYWPDCPFKKYLGAGELNFDFNEVTVLHSAAGKDWSQCVLDYLQQIDSEYILLMLDDFFIRSRVETNKVFAALEFAQNNKAKQVRLIPRPGPTKYTPSRKLFGECLVGTRYRVSTQAAIWSKAALRNLLVPNESAWEFERNANLRAEEFERGFYASIRALVPYEGMLAHHVIEKGCWLPHEKWIFRHKEIGCDFSARKSLSWTHAAQCQIARVALMMLGALPHSVAEFGRRWMRRIVYRLAPKILFRLSGGKHT